MISVDSATSRISDKDGFDGVVVEFTPETGDTIRAWSLTFGEDRANDKRLDWRGGICGLFRCNDGTYPTLIPDGTQITAGFNYDDTQPAADGTYPIGVHAAGEEEWA